MKATGLISLVAGISLAFALAGCGNGYGTPPSLPQAPTSGEGPTGSSNSPNSPHYSGSPPGNPPSSGGGSNPSPPADPGPAPGLPPGDGYDMIFYQNYGVNPFILTEDEDTSTFGMDVDTASYTIARYYLIDNHLPDKDSIRTEEFINYFDQDYPEPEGAGVFSLNLEGAESQFGRPDFHLLKIGLKARDVWPDERPSANMVFVVDRSGSMASQDRLEQVKKSLHMLVDDLREGDKIGLVGFDTEGQVISDLTSDHAAILAAIDQLYPRGTTNTYEGLTLGYTMAYNGFEDRKINRIILCSDGVANTGTTDPEEMLAQVKSQAEKGITLTTLGFGMGNYNDVLMEKLADHGDGSYYYIDSEDEAARLFEDGAFQLLMVLASDAKIQVVFNGETVEKYRLIGYENRLLEEKDFEDDTVDAGEVGPGQTVTALYEIHIRPEAIDLTSAAVATVKIRYMNYETRMIETAEKTIIVRQVTRDFALSSRMFQFTAAVAEFAEILKQSYWAEGSSLESVNQVVNGIAMNEKETEFVLLVQRAMDLGG